MPFPCGGADLLPRRLVIDTSILAAAGGSSDATSDMCRRLLRSVLAICHQAVVTDSIKAEWELYQSKFARSWRSAMLSRRKLVRPGRALQQELVTRVRRLPVDDRAKHEMETDLHLVEAALRTDLLSSHALESDGQISRRLHAHRGTGRDHLGTDGSRARRRAELAAERRASRLPLETQETDPALSPRPFLRTIG